MTQRDGMTTSVEGEAGPGRGKGVDDISWVSTNFTGPKNEENPCGPFNYYKWMMKI
jgi:hypothetical protein